MMKEFIKRDYIVYALGNEPEEKWKEKFEIEGIRYRQIDVSRNGTNPIRDIKSLISIYNVLKELCPTKIFTYQAKTVIYGGIAASLLGIKEVYTLIAGVGSIFLNDTVKTRLIRNIIIMEYRVALRNSKTIFFQNNDDLLVFQRCKMISDKQRVEMIPGSGVNIDWYSMMPMPNVFGFLYIGRLIRDKGIYEYLEACRSVKKTYPNIRCLLVGPFDSNPSAFTVLQLQSYIDEGIVEFFGEQDDVRPYFAQCSVFVLPSYREGIPKTVLEAMACGRAIITTDVPGCRDTVDNGIEGWVVPAKDTEALKKAMYDSILNPQAVITMGINCRKKATDVFDVRIVNELICRTMGIHEQE